MTISGQEFALQVSPPGGLSSGGGLVTVQGIGFSENMKIQVGGVDCLTSTFLSETSLACLVPPNPQGNSNLSQVFVDVSGLNEQGAYTYLGQPSFWLDAAQYQPNLGIWPDRSGYSLKATVSIPVPSPSFIPSPVPFPSSAPALALSALNSFPSVSFDGSSCMSSPSGLPGSTNYTFSLVMNQASSTTPNPILSSGTYSGFIDFLFNQSLYPALWVYGAYSPGSYYPQQVLVSNQSISLESFSTLTHAYENGPIYGSQFYINGVLAGSSSSGPLAQSGKYFVSPFSIGCDPNLNYLRGEIAELFIYGKFLTDSERGALEGYLRAKYLHY